MHRVHLAAVPEVEQRSPGGKFQSWCRNLSLALGGLRHAGTWGGGHPFDLQIRRIPPGASVCPFHAHFAQWELFVVLRGTATVRAGPETHTAAAGEVFIHPPGEPHQLGNPGPEDLEVLIITDNPPWDAFHYPDSNKWGLRPLGKYFRLTETDYFDGEEAPTPDAPPYQPVPAPPGPALAPFASRKLHPDALPWVPWASPMGKFRGTGKSLSIALGAQPNTPTGLGGHPFDLELGKLAPGECGCPFHVHAAQWECFLFLSGAGTVRTAAGLTPVGAGDVVLHPPGEAHQLTNTGTSDLLYYLVADNPPLDICHYPDSGKWNHSSPRKIFRATDAEYWDGEE
ncbi:Cupin domain protein [Lacunisphaera limnophila]|uniref:Cupin domain protein n=1 Tax=Lacunisphaera limnophila TaxID=1838286 RepID=A0A1D8ARU7_9BACT|nr:cupin domain-containing protein [Lacunisphaera limnophila]AOS43602.1 Cupin domain protein [Lacunisphaera limnophila]